MSGFNITPNPAALRAGVNSTYTAPGQPGGSVAGLQGARLPVAGVSGGSMLGGMPGMSFAPAAAAAGSNYAAATGGLRDRGMIPERQSGNTGSAPNMAANLAPPSNPTFYGR